MWCSRPGCSAETQGHLTAAVQMCSVQRLPQAQQTSRQMLVDPLGVVVGVVVAGIGHGGSSPKFVEHELLLSGTQWRARDGVPGGVDVLPCPALGDEGGHFHAFVFAREAWKQGERGSGVVGEMTIDGLFDRWIIRACLLMQTGLRGWMRGHVNGLQTPTAVGSVFAGWRSARIRGRPRRSRWRRVRVRSVPRVRVSAGRLEARRRDEHRAWMR